MKLLDNELVQKYFHWERHTCVDAESNDGLCSGGESFVAIEIIARRVLESMQQPIKKNDNVLSLCNGEWKEWTVNFDLPKEDFHPTELRLPDRFQTKDEVEEKINEIAKEYDSPNQPPPYRQLHELVVLVHKESKKPFYGNDVSSHIAKLQDMDEIDEEKS